MTNETESDLATIAYLAGVADEKARGRAAVAELVEDMRLIRAMLTPCKGSGGIAGDAFKIADAAISRHQAGLGKGGDRG